MMMLRLFLSLLAPVATMFGQEARSVTEFRAIKDAEVSARPNPIPVREVYETGRDWKRQPFRLAVMLVEFSDKKHADVHSLTFYDKLLFSRNEYLKTPSGKASYGSLADWYRGQSQDRFSIEGKVFDWVTIDQTFDAIHSLKLSEAHKQYLKVAMTKIRQRDGEKALEEFDGYLFIHAGPITGPSNNIFWSHRADVAGKRYFTTGEVEEIGVFCHEFGHMIGLPDFYEKKGERKGFGPWCTMATGYRGLYPKSFCAWSKVRLGWCKPTVVDAAIPQKLSLRPIQSNPNDAIIIPLNRANEVGAEFLLLENRAAHGNDTEGQAGLFIWRIRIQTGKNGQPLFEQTLPGPADKPNSRQNTRRVAWPAGEGRDFVISAKEADLPVAIRDIRLDGEVISFFLGPD